MKTSAMFLMCITVLGLSAITGNAIAAHHEKSTPMPPWLGVAVSELPFDAFSELNIDYGVSVDEVREGSPAEKAGLRADDVIVKLDGKPVFSVSRLQWLVRTYEVGDDVLLDIRRDGDARQISVTLAARDSKRAGHPLLPRHHGATSGSFLGVTLQELGDDLREHFGAPADQGVLIAKVVDDSPAAEAKLQVGDVIVRMDRKRIRQISDVYRVLRYFDAGDEIEVEVVRDRQRLVLNVTLAARAHKHGDHHGGHPHWPPHFSPEYWHNQLKRYRDHWRDNWKHHHPPYDHRWGPGYHSG